MDEKRGIAYFPTGIADLRLLRGRPDRCESVRQLPAWRSMRAPGSVCGISRLVHHDLWDYDTTAGAEAADGDGTTGRRVDVVAQSSKQGFLYVFERVTGEPLWPIEERPVPKSEAPASNPGQRSRCPQNRPHSHGRSSPRTISIRMYRRPRRRASGRSCATRATKECSRRLTTNRTRSSFRRMTGARIGGMQPRIRGAVFCLFARRIRPN